MPAAARAAAARTITIDPHAGETFAPAPASAAPKLTAQQAWARYAARNGARTTTIPTGVTVRLGLLTLPIGPKPDGPIAYTAHKELAYGYSSPSGCVSTLPGAVLAGARCLSWTFLNANTGNLTDQTWQKTGHRHMPGPRPGHARQVQTGPDIQQWQETGTTITSLWMDLEAGMIVQITGQSLDRNPRQGEISIDVITEASGDGHIGRYRGGIYPTPREVGPVTLTGVTGSLATRNMVVSFSYAGGTGTFTPRTRRFSMP